MIGIVGIVVVVVVVGVGVVVVGVGVGACGLATVMVTSEPYSALVPALTLCLMTVPSGWALSA